MTQTTDLINVIDRLSKLEQECPCLDDGMCKGCRIAGPPDLVAQNMIDCWKFCDCKGTGKVATFPSLREDCDDCAGTGYQGGYRLTGRGKDEQVPKRKCRMCKGVSWFPVAPDEIDLNKLMMECHHLNHAGGLSIYDLHTIGGVITDSLLYGKSPIEAVLNAIGEVGE